VQPILALYDIEKRFQDRIALRLDYLAIESARLHLLTGPNGSGKSTLLQVMGFLDAPDQGTVELGGKKTGWLASWACEARQQVTLVHQNPYMIKGSVADNVAYGLKLRGLRGNALDEQVAAALEQVQLEGFARRDARGLSGGETRRVAIARALACSPRLLLLDEPLANLDQQSSILIEGLIAGLPAKGTAVVMSSHDAGHLERLDAVNIRLEAGVLVKPVVSRPQEYGYGWDRQGLCPLMVNSR
jgi:tungstate transport system ATP-binding protein